MCRVSSFAFLLLWTLPFHVLHSQNLTFQKVFSDPDLKADARGFDVLPTGTSQYLVAGLTDSLDGGLMNHGLLFLTDSTGQTLWQKRFFEGEYAHLMESVEAPDGGFVVLGQVALNGSEMQTLLLKTDASGNLLWNLCWNTVTLFNTNQKPWWNLLALPDGYLVTGIRSGATQGFILRIDLAGNTLWHKSYDFSPVAGSVSGDTLFVGGPVGTRYCFAQISLTTGDVFSAVRLMGNGNGAAENSRLLPTPGGEFFLLGRGGLALDKIWCAKINRNGQVIWSKLYSEAAMTLTAAGFQATQDGGLVFACRKSAPSAPVAFKIDASGFLDWSYGLDTQGALFLQNVVEEPNGHLVFTGSVRIADAHRVLLLRTNPNGLVEGCCFRPFPVLISNYPVTSVLFAPVVGSLPPPGPKALTVKPVSLSVEDFCTAAPYTQRQVQLCPEEIIIIGGVLYTAPAMVFDTLTSVSGCDSVVEYTLSVYPLQTRSETVNFCPGDSVWLNGQFYHQPGMVLDTLPGPLGCDTVATYLLQFANAGQSANITLDCPASVTVEAGLGADFAPVSFDPAIAVSDCVCPGISLVQSSGFPGGSAFPIGTTAVCFTAADSCQTTASCCFEVTVTTPPQEACDIKSIGCLKYELLRIAQDSQGRRSYQIRLTNNCNAALSYLAVQQPDGVVAAGPATGSVYAAPGGNNYLVRNPNFTPFYSIRFKPQGPGLQNGQSDIFQYTLPPQSEPLYIHVAAKLTGQSLLEAHLNTFNCPVEKVPLAQPAFDRGGAQDETRGTFHFYPNPATGVLFLDLSAWPDQALRVFLYTAQGQLCASWPLRGAPEPQALELPADLANGFYFLKIAAGGGVFVVGRVLLHR